MNLKISAHIPIALLAIHSLTLNAQSVSELQNSYSGTTDWNSATGTLTFTSSGTVTFIGKAEPAKTHFWEVPTEVKTIVIEENDTVTCAFHTSSTITIKGENRKTSVVYGTDMRSWAQNNNVKAYKHCQFQNFGGTMTITNLTSLNPFGFHVRGWGKLMMVSDCDFLDTRGGAGNHSDGIEGGNGSVIDNCYFETGDDIFKIYFDNTITNCTVNMVQNAVPIQLGWGNYSNGAVGTIKNLTIIGNSGRGNKQSFPIICGRRGIYDVTLHMDSCHIVNPKAHLVMLWDDNDDGVYEKSVGGTITNSYIDVKGYTNYHLGTSNFEICGTTERKGKYDCWNTTNMLNATLIKELKIYPNPVKNKLIVESNQAISIYNAQGKHLSVPVTVNNNQHIINTANLTNGIYFIKTGKKVHPFMKM